MKNTKLATAGIALGLFGAGAAGFALGLPGVSSAQTSSTDPAAATAPADPQAAYETHLRDTLKPLVDNGTITQSQLDAVVGALKSAAPPVKGHGARGMRGGFDLDTVAKSIGVSEADLRTALQSGQSIADYAKSKNVDPQTVIDALVAEMKTRLAASVTAGKMTQADADKLAADAQTRIADMVNNVHPAGGFGRGHRGPGGAAPSTTAPSTTAPTTTN